MISLAADAAADSGSTTTTVVVTAIGLIVVAIIGGVASAFAATYASKKRIKEVELTQQHKLQEIYLSNAREYLESIYLPLHLAQARLATAFRTFRLGRDSTDSDESQAATADFTKAINVYLIEIDDLLDRAAGAFLTAALEDRIGELSSLLRASLTSTKPIWQNVYSFSTFGLSTGGTIKTTRQAPKIRLNLFPFAMSASITEDKVLQAPLNSEAFEEVFVTQTAVIQNLIKEVTLGAHAAS